VRGANSRIAIAQIGLGARGQYETTINLTTPGVEILAVCDPYQALVDLAIQKVGGKVQGYQDFRRVLDRKDIDAVFVSTPDHWHAPISIMACMAGKDVYCEKPLTHTIEEGQVMVKAARRYNRVVQTGSQQRSAPHFAKVQELIQGSYIGKVSFVECWNISNNYPEGFGKGSDEDPPSGLDWDMYLGPAPKVPYNRNRFIWNYRWFWDYSGGMMTDWGAHHMDSIHQIMGVDAPVTVASNGRTCLEDGRETPDCFVTAFEYPGFVATYTHSLLNDYRIARRDTGMMFHGTSGTLIVDRSSYEVVPQVKRPWYGGGDMIQELFADWNTPLHQRRQSAYAQAFEPQAQCEPIQVTGINLDPDIQIVHVHNFLDCVRSRRRTNAPWEIGHRSVTACHLGVIAQRTGRKIHWHAANEKIVGDPEASRMLSKPYRAPWTLPKV
jgi:predicted dehydrogenase